MAKQNNGNYPNTWTWSIFEPETNRLIKKLFFQKRIRHWRRGIAPGILIVAILANSFLAQANISYFYSPLCLGGWKYPKNVQGEPQVPIGSDVSAFSESNSAVLHNSNSQIFCGQFASDTPPTQELRSVRLILSLAIESKIKEVPVSDFETGKTLDAPADQTQTFIIGPPEPSVTDQTPSTPTPTAKPTIKAAPLPIETMPVDERISSTVTPEPAESIVPTQTPATPTPVPVESTPIPSTSGGATGQVLPTSLLDLIVPTANADVNPSTPDSSLDLLLNADDLLEIRYTNDGVNWQTLGTINKNAWQGQPFQIPVTSGDEIANLQISISVLPTLDSDTTVYLDSMWLEAEYDSGITEFVKNIGQGILDALTLQPLLQEPSPSPVIAISSPTPTPKIKIREYGFKTESDSKAKLELSWYDRETNEKAKILNSSLSSVNIRNDAGNSLTMAGQCREKYFVILVYRNGDDYDKNPVSAVYNSAFPCVNGQINHKLTELPNVESGTYYLLIAEQGSKGGWIPVSNITKIDLAVTEKEVAQ